MTRYSVAIHASACLILIFLFGSNLLSLSVDLPHHLAVVDDLMRNGAASSPHLTGMALYPFVSHWLVAVTGYLTGSGLVAIWFVSIVSIYAAYYFIVRLVLADRALPAALLFVCLAAAALPSLGIVGFEVVDNFFFPQLVAMVIYFAVLLLLVENAQWPVLARAMLVLLLFAVTLEVHPLPALHMVGAFCVLLTLELVLGSWRVGRFDWRLFLVLCAFILGSVLVLSFNKSFRAMAEFSQNDGSLSFGRSVWLFAGLSVVMVPASAWAIWCRWKRGEAIPSVDLVLFAALSASLFVIIAQYAALLLADRGSPYAIKKHFFIAVTLGLIVLARLIANLLPAWRQRSSQWLMASCGALIIALLLLARPGYSIYPVEKAFEFAERAVEMGHPEFQPGNTYAINESLPPVMRYLLTTVAFRADVGQSSSVKLLNGDFIPQEDAAFVMVDRTPELVAKCEKRYAETSKFVILPTSCLGARDANLLSFGAGRSANNTLIGDWWPTEQWGVWTRGNQGVVRVALSPELRSGDVEMIVSSNAFIAAKKPSLAVDVLVNGTLVASLEIRTPLTTSTIRIPHELAKAGSLEIAFNAKDAVSPASVNYNADTRVLGLGLRSLRFQAAPG